MENENGNVKQNFLHNTSVHISFAFYTKFSQNMETAQPKRGLMPSFSLYFSFAPRSPPARKTAGVDGLAATQIQGETVRLQKMDALPFPQFPPSLFPD